MSLDSIGLIAQQSYTQIQDRPKINDNDSTLKAASFQDVVSKQFNSFKAMSPQQILSHIQNAKNMEASSFMVANNGNAFGNAANSLRSAISNQEKTARKSLIGEASLIDLLTATTEAQVAMKATVEIRNKFMESFEKVMSMSM